MQEGTTKSAEPVHLVTRARGDHCERCGVRMTSIGGEENPDPARWWYTPEPAKATCAAGGAP